MILHERDYDRYEDSDKMQGILEKLRPEYDKNSGKRPDCGDLVTRVQQAERRGEVLLQRRRESLRQSINDGRLSHSGNPQSR